MAHWGNHGESRSVARTDASPSDAQTRSPVGVLRERVADRRGRNIGSVAAARRQLELVFYALRDGHLRALEHLPRVA